MSARCACRLPRDAAAAELRRGRAEADDAGDVLQTAAAGTFLRATHHERLHAQPASHEQRAHTLRAAELVRGDGAQIGAEADEVDVGVARGGARVDVHQHAALACLCDDGRRGLERADFVVGELDRDERGVGADRADHLVGIEAPAAVDPDLGDGEAFRAPARVEHGRVLHRSGDDVAFPSVFERTPDRGVDRFGAARGEHHLARARAEQRGHLLACVLDCDARRAAFGVQAPGVAVMVAEVRHHRVERLRAQRRRRRVIEIRARHGSGRVRRGRRSGRRRRDDWSRTAGTSRRRGRRASRGSCRGRARTRRAGSAARCRRRGSTPTRS